MTARPPWWGSVTADVLVLDTPVIGPDAARERVLAAWRPGSTLHSLPDGRWALRLEAPGRWRAETSPGLPLRLGGDGVLTWSTHGVEHRSVLDRLPRVPTDAWFDLGGLRVEHLGALEAPAPPPDVVVGPPAPPTLDLPGAAGIARDPRAAATSAELARRGNGRGAGAPQPGGRSRFAELMLSSPTGVLLARRHARYLRALSEDLERKRYDAALRSAISLTGEGGRLSLRMPQRRSGPLRPRTGPEGRGRSLAGTTPTVEQHLRRLYLDAAAQLERDGRIEEAAFVHADLLGGVHDAVLLLERHGQHMLGATLAEARGLQPEVAVRLWWLAGERRRAIDLARGRGAFAAVLAHLSPADGHAWRAEWIEFARAAGDPVGAVRAAWPVAGLRDAVRDDLTRAIAMGGPDAAEMFALALTHAPSAAAVSAAEGLLTRRLADDEPGTLRFVETLATWPVRDAATDRRLVTQALRLVVREPRLLGDLPAPTRRRLTTTLRSRADPLAAADLATPARWQGVATATSSITLAGTGQVPVLDAAVTSVGVLVALGEHGVRLLGPAGQVLARWNVPARQIVLADHGAAALLVVRGDALSELHRLDLAARTVAPWVTLELQSIAGSYDGGSVLATDRRGIVMLDTTGAGVRELWRNPIRAGSEQVLALARGATGCAALIRADGRGTLTLGLHLWRWSLPDLLLRARDLVELPEQSVSSVAVASGGTLITVHGRDFQGLHSVRRQIAYTPATFTSTAETVDVVSAGSSIAMVSSGPQGLLVSPAPGNVPAADARWQVILPGAMHVSELTIRIDASRVTIGTSDGRVVALDASSGQVLARFATRA